jgi:hypothetical protein
MKEILLINPGRPKRKRSTKKRATKRKTPARGAGGRFLPAKRKTTARKAAGKKKTTVSKKTTNQKAGSKMAKRKKRTYKRNPSGRSVASRALGGLNLPKAMIDSTKMAGGMLIAQFFAKKFAEGGGANDRDWTVKNYAFAALGALAAGLGGNMIKRGSGNEMFKGGLALVLYKIVTNEIAPTTPWLEDQLGQINPAYGVTEPMYLPAAEYDVADEVDYLLGQGDVYRPAADEDYPEMGEYEFLGEPIVPTGSLGEAITEVSDLGEDPYMEAFYN